MNNKVREIRKGKNMTVKELASKADISLSMVYQVERNERIPSLKVAQRISHILGCNTDKIFFE